MTTHVFIVDHRTFPLHLEYMFAGTGGKNDHIDFNNQAASKLNHSSEKNLAAMMADANRVRKGDYIIFHLQKNKRGGILDGKFYGIFKAKENWSFLDNNSKDLYLSKKLGKNLNFRTLIEPYEVYPDGLTEWEVLDDIKHINSTYPAPQSLVYRKMKGNRGNTMLTTYESDRLCQHIRDKNYRQEL